MTTNTFNVYPLRYDSSKAYLLILAFAAGNILLATGCHAAPVQHLDLARVFLPTFFFTLIAAYKYGLFVGISTAVITLIANYLLFALPQGDLLTAVAVKTSLLAMAAGFAGIHFRKVNPLILAGIVFSYQLVGTMIVCVLGNTNESMIAAFVVSWPGMLIQIIGGWLILRYIMNK